MNSEREKLAVMESFGEELVFFVNGRKVCGNILRFHSIEFISPLSLSKSRLFRIEQSSSVIFIYCRFWSETQSQR